MKIFWELLIPFKVLFKKQFLKSMFFLKAYPKMEVFFKNTIAGKYVHTYGIAKMFAYFRKYMYTCYINSNIYINLTFPADS